MANYSSILVWEISKTEELGRLQSMGLQESDVLVTKPPPYINKIEWKFRDKTCQLSTRGLKKQSLQQITGNCGEMEKNGV